MALQGTLETFSVPEVLRLLSSTRKTGMLALEGDRGHGSVWLGEGSIISARSDHEGTGDIDATLFDLLRFATGEFVFEPDATPDHPVSAEVDVDEALTRAEELLSEWQELESVVPSLLVGVRLARELQGETATVTAEQWRALAAIGDGTSAAGLGQRLGLGELDTCRRLRELIEASFVELTDDVADEPDTTESPRGHDLDADTTDADDDVADAWDGRPQLVDHDLSSDEVESLSSNLAGFMARAPEPEDDIATFDLSTGVQDHEGVEESADEAPVDDHDPVDHPPMDFEDEPDPAREVAEAFDDEAGSPTVVETPDDFLAQLTNLSPKAAAAIEATAEEATARAEEQLEEHGGASAPEGDEEINRNLLLKFLSSTKN